MPNVGLKLTPLRLSHMLYWLNRPGPLTVVLTPVSSWSGMCSRT